MTHALDVCVIGASAAGLAVALRAAKLGHRVVLLEAADAIGGAARPIRVGEFDLDLGAADTLLPAALRDLFRKSGRPLERELDLVSIEGVRRFHAPGEGRTPLDLPILGRGAQSAAIGERFGADAAQAWTTLLDRLGERWDGVRQVVENEPAPPCRVSRWQRFTEKGFSADVRLLRGVGADGAAEMLTAAIRRPLRRDGHDPTASPAALGVLPYLEQNLGRWRPVGGSAALLDVIAARLDLRKVDVRLGCRALNLIVSGGVVAGVRTDHGDHTADVVVSAVGVPSLIALAGDRLPSLTQPLRRLRPAITPARTLVRIPSELVPDAYETVFVGSALVLRPIPADGTDPTGTTWVGIEHDGTGDALRQLAERGRAYDFTRATVERHDLPTLAWANGAAVISDRSFGRLSPVTPSIRGLLVTGRASYLPVGLPAELLSGALAVSALDAPTTFS